MLHNANIYSNSKEGNAHFLYMLKVVRKCSILLRKQKQERNVIFYKDNN